MSSITEKIDYLKETKRLLKEVILKHGGLVDDTTPFRDYVTIIDNLLTNQTQIQTLEEE